MEQSIYWLSDIYFDQNSTKVKILDLETGKDIVLDVNEKDKLSMLYSDFKNTQDIEAIKVLQEC